MAIRATSHQSFTVAPTAPQSRVAATPRPMTGAQILCAALEQEGVEALFGYPGGTIMPFYDALSSSRLRHVLVRHEQAAAHAADGYARATGRVGVCVATSGPGATNLVTGIATAYMDSVPLVAITGQVATHMIGTDAFQETDIIGITQPITKHSFQVTSVAQLAGIVHEAFAIARSGRPGPVLIDVPKNVQQAIGAEPEPWRPEQPSRPEPDERFAEAIIQAATLIDQAERPVIIAGHGVIIAGAYKPLRDFAEKTGAPVVTTLLGISAFPESHPLAVGMPGMHGRAKVNHAIHESDVIIAVGMRFDDRVTGTQQHFAPHARIIHIDIDPSEMGKVFQPAIPIVADAYDALEALTIACDTRQHERWISSIGLRHAERPGDSMHAVAQREDGARAPEPAAILAAIRKATDGRAVIVSDVGQHQMWVARHYGYETPNTHLSSGGLGTMGFALPAAMGAAIGRPGEPIWVVAGDGGIQMNIQELATIVALGLPIKVAIFNNGYLGMVRQWQEFFYERNYSETRISGPDYEKLAAAYGATGMRVDSAVDVEAAIERAMRSDGPVVVDFIIEQGANVYPMVAPGKANIDMIHATRSDHHA